MSKHLKFREIQSLLHSLSSQLASMNEKQGISAIEADILLADIRTLYSSIKNLPLVENFELSETFEKKLSKEAKPEEISSPNELPPVIPVEMNKSSQGASLADKFPQAPSLHHKISKSQENKSIAEQLQKKAIPDLKISIGINEKFLFINKLYKGNSQEFDTDLNYINSCENEYSAVEYLRENAWSKYNWNAEDEVLVNYLNLIERRFLAN